MDDKIPTFKLILVCYSGTMINIILTIFIFFFIPQYLQGTGKSCLLNRYTKGSWMIDSYPTIGAEF